MDKGSVSSSSSSSSSSSYPSTSSSSTSFSSASSTTYATSHGDNNELYNTDDNDDYYRYDDEDDRVNDDDSNKIHALDEQEQDNTTTNKTNNDSDDHYSIETRNWTERIPIGLRFCPWAIQSHRQNRIVYVSCLATNSKDVHTFLRKEMESLVVESVSSVSSVSVPWTTKLIICPCIEEWNQNFTVFDDFVKSFWNEQTKQNNTDHDVIIVEIDNEANDDAGDEIGSTSIQRVQQQQQQQQLQQLKQHVTLVAFHPQFVRWFHLPHTIKVGSIVQCHKGMSGFMKSPNTYWARIVETTSPMFGQRRSKVQFLENDSDNDQEQQQQQQQLHGDDNNNSASNNNNNNNNHNHNTAQNDNNNNNYNTRSRTRKEQYVPIDWIVFDRNEKVTNSNSDNDNDDDSHTTNNNTSCQQHQHQQRQRILQRPLQQQQQQTQFQQRQPLVDNCMHQTPYPTIHIIQNSDLDTLCIRDISRLKRKNAQYFNK